MDKTDSQIHNRLIADADLVSDAYVDLSEVVTGHMLFHLFSAKKAKYSFHALAAVLEYYGIHKSVQFAGGEEDPLEQMNRIIKSEGIMQREVSLSGSWYKDAFGVYIGTLDDDTIVALIPGRGGYFWVNSQTGEKVRVNRQNAKRVNADALCFYAPLPESRLTVTGLMKHIMREVTFSDIFKIVIFTLAATLLSMITPAATQLIFGELAMQSKLMPLVIIFILLFSTSVSVFLINTAKNICLSSLNIKIDASIYSAIMMRIFNLPSSFFKEMTSGEIHARIESVSHLCSTLLNTIFSGLLTAVMSLIYLFQIFVFSKELLLPALITVFVMLGFNVAVAFAQSRLMIKLMDSEAKEEGFIYIMLNGIQKIRTSGAEGRFLGKWMEKHKESTKKRFAPPFVIRFSQPITVLITMLGAGLLYYIAYISTITGAEYLAFNSAYGMMSGAFLSLNGVLLSAAAIKPILKFIQPILNTTPEVDRSRKTVASLSGRIGINQVTFAYKPGAAPVLNRLSLDIAPGEYVAIVGKSGCGKSTLMRLLLGFEKPQQGSITYDDIDISSVNLKSLRQHIGCVIQNASLFTGSIRSNIAITAPLATDEDVWKAAEMAGIADDIRSMPMGMETLIMEGAGISGGQKQRIIIARAIISKPDILFMDEATSALDNITQKTVTDSLVSLNCTRVVIAHRLSTVKDCDRIVMIGDGHIIESGTYDELMEMDGQFAAMVRRQQI